MAITASLVNELRQITGAGMMDCKKALTEADGDIEKAIDILRKKGQKVSANRADREAKEGSVLVHTSADGTEGFALSLNCETDFVAKNAEFLDLGQRILKTAVKLKPANVEALNASKIDDRTVAEHITDYVGKIGEKIEVSLYNYFKGEQVVSYIHGDGKIGVLVKLANASGVNVAEVGRDICMQIAAMKPVAVDESQVDPTLVQREKEIGLEKARQEGKPEQVLEKIAEGFVKKYYQENTLIHQAFVKDNKLTVKQYLDSVKKGLTVTEFARLGIGR